MILFYFQDVSVVAFSKFQASKQLNIKSILCTTWSGNQARNKDAGIESQKTEAKLAEMVNERRRMKILNYCNFGYSCDEADD